MRTFNFETIAPKEVVSILQQGKALDCESNKRVKLSGTDRLMFNGTLKSYADWLTLADNDKKEFQSTISKLPNGKVLPLEVYPTETDFAVLIYIIKGSYRITIYDTVQCKSVEKVGKFDKWFEATKKAREIANQYK